MTNGRDEAVSPIWCEEGGILIFIFVRDMDMLVSILLGREALEYLTQNKHL